MPLSLESKKAVGQVAKVIGCSCLIVTIVGGGFLFAVLLWLSRGVGMNSDAEWSGWEAAWIGDVDGDGVPEVALMTWCEPVSVVARDRGVLRVLSGASGATLATFRDLGTQGSVENRIGPAGDMDGGGRTEVWWMIGDRELLVGPLGSPRFVLDIEAGSRCTPLGDLDGDGCVDLRVTRSPVRPEGSIVSSLVSGRSGAILWSITESHGYPGPACRIEDIDGDGIDDIALSDCTQQVRIVSGDDGASLHVVPFYVADDGLLHALGDLDGDGIDEVMLYKGSAVLKDWQPGQTRSKSIEILSAKDGRVLAPFPNVYSYAGEVQVPGDVNGDGVDDIACSGQTLWVFSGANLNELLQLEGSLGGGSGDWNADGCADLLVTHNLKIYNPEEVPPDLWRLGRIEIVSGKDCSVLKTIDESVLPAGQ